MMGKPLTIGVAFPRWMDVFSQMIAGITGYALTDQRLALLDWSYHRPDELRQRLTACQPDQPGRPAGLLTWMEQEDLAEICRHFPAGLVALSFDHGPDLPNVHPIRTDRQAECSLLVDHFIAAGLKHLAVLKSQPADGPHCFASDFQRHADRHGLPTVIGHYPCLSGSNAHHSRPGRMLEQWLDTLPRPVGVVCDHPFAASWLVRACLARGLQVPADVAIVSRFDDRSCLLSPIPITTLNWPTWQIGYQMTADLCRRLRRQPARPPRPVRPTGLLVRPSSGQADGDGQAIDRALRYMTEHACQPIGIEEIYDRTQHTSRTRFFQLFRQHTGLTPYQYLRRLRIARACHYLATTDLSVAHIAVLCGYTEPRHFSSAFKKEVGQTPLAYRKKGDHRPHHAAIGPASSAPDLQSLPA